jgi:hypothetical protein
MLGIVTARLLANLTVVLTTVGSRNIRSRTSLAYPPSVGQQHILKPAWRGHYWYTIIDKEKFTFSPVLEEHY